MTDMTRRLLALAAALAAALVFAAPAQAVTKNYCWSSLHGGGSLAPDNDVKIHWDAVERRTGRDIVARSLVRWSGNDGDYQLNVLVKFHYANGDTFSNWFICYGSGSGYRDIFGL